MTAMPVKLSQKADTMLLKIWDINLLVIRFNTKLIVLKYDIHRRNTCFADEPTILMDFVIKIPTICVLIIVMCLRLSYDYFLKINKNLMVMSLKIRKLSTETVIVR